MPATRRRAHRRGRREARAYVGDGRQAARLRPPEGPAPFTKYLGWAMPRAIWTGAISFGLVNVPVKLYSAVQRKGVRFNQLDSEGNVRIQQKRVNPLTGEEVPYERLVKGYEVAPDRYVVIEPDELEAVEPRRTRTIDILDFVELREIDPIFYDHPYYLRS